ncbi:MAG: nucleoside hydrolase [Chloroflexi bacterium]|nr:nucleoside hydrolase [Chloroflexota bacterium]
MKRKGWIRFGIVIGSLAILLILIWPAARLWRRLGIEPICIQGTLPDLKFVPCPSPVADQPVGTPRPLPTLSNQGPIPLIVDDDGSPDGTVALLFFLRHPLFEVKAVTISSGEAHPEVFAAHIQKLLAGLGRPGIPVGIGRAAPLEGNNAFPDSWRRASDNFWGVSYPEATVSQQPQPADQLIVETILGSTRPVMVFVSGTHTNLAEALRLNPGIAKNIQAVNVMGGSLHVPGNIKSAWPAIDNSLAEWNIWVDPVAADEVFASGLQIHLAPLDSTEQILWTKADASNWSSSTTPEGKLAADFLKWMLNSRSSQGVYIWDLVAAINTADPALCPPVSLSVDILTNPGPDQGQTVITDQSPNTIACLDPEADQMKALAADVLGR